MTVHSRRVLIVGGVAGGASCAARLRRLDENAEIVLFDRGPHVSFAMCGLPYYVGNVIADENQLLLTTPEQFAARFRIEVRASSEVLSVDRSLREVRVRNLQTGATYSEPYDALVLSPGAIPVRPELPGVDLPGIFTLRTIPDSRRIRDWIERRHAQRAVVAGGGPVGLEMAENLARRGLKVSIIEMLPQVLAALDPEMAEPVHRHLESHRIDLRLGEPVTGFDHDPQGALAVMIGEGRRPIAADLVILAMGVRPENGLARAAGLAVGDSGGIRVNKQMRTSDPAIWAVGDAVEVRDAVTGARRLMPLAGLANKQSRVAADSICGRASSFGRAHNTAVCGVFGLTAAVTGANEKCLLAAGVQDYECVYLHPGHHASYYPGAQPIHLKLIFRRSDGRILGAQAVGAEGVERRIDVLSVAIQRQSTVFHLEQSEMCYAPQYGSAKDPLNLAGMIASNVLRGDVHLAPWRELPTTKAILMDVRDGEEFAAGHIEGAVNIPLSDLRQRIGEIPAGPEIWVYCGVGQRSYYAGRILEQRGRRARMLSGGYQTYWGWNE